MELLQRSLKQNSFWTFCVGARAGSEATDALKDVEAHLNSIGKSCIWLSGAHAKEKLALAEFGRWDFECSLAPLPVVLP